MNIYKSIVVLLGVLLVTVSCNDQVSLQEYFVDSSENPDFISVDIPASMLKLDEVDLTQDQKEAYQSLKKFNVLAYRVKEDNKAAFEAEKAKVNEILKDEDYQELMKFNHNGAKGVIKYLGTDEAIDEVIIFGNQAETGFALVRVLGEGMKPANMMQLVDAVQKTNLGGEGFKKIGEFLGKTK